VATAIPAGNPDILPETAQIQTRYRRQQLLLLQPEAALDTVDEEASKDAVAASMSQPTELRRATSVEGPTTMLGIARLRL
jgi:hypothetical protein